MSTVSDTRDATHGGSASSPVDGTPRSAPERRAALTTLPATRLVAAREIAVKLRDKAFLISTAVTLAIIAGSILVPALFLDGGAEEHDVAAVGPVATAALTDAGKGAPDLRLTAVPAADAVAAERAVSSGDVDAALLPAPGGQDGGLQLVADDTAPSDLLDALNASVQSQRTRATLSDLGASADQVSAVTSAPVTLRLLDDSGTAQVASIVAIVFAALFFFTVFTFGFQIAQSVTEEKASRVVELLVAAVPIRALLVGKVAGTSVLAVGQMVVLLAGGMLALAATGQGDLIATVAPASGWFLVFFLLGFTMLSTLWAAAGALAARIEDLQSTTVPMQMLVLPPFFVGVYVTTPGTLLTALSYVPFTAPLSMPRRLLIGDASWWEALVSAGIIAATTVVLVAVASRLYRGSLLRTGSKSSVKAAWAAAARG